MGNNNHRQEEGSPEGIQWLISVGYFKTNCKSLMPTVWQLKTMQQQYSLVEGSQMIMTDIHAISSELKSVRLGKILSEI